MTQDSLSTNLCSSTLFYLHSRALELAIFSNKPFLLDNSNQKHISSVVLKSAFLQPTLLSTPNIHTYWCLFCPLRPRGTSQLLLPQDLQESQESWLSQLQNKHVQVHTPSPCKIFSRPSINWSLPIKIRICLCFLKNLYRISCSLSDFKSPAVRT